MAITQRLEVRLSHKLILTPSLQQAIKLLPMSTLELVDMLHQEVVENPLAAQVDKADPEPPATTDRQDMWEDADYEYFFGEYLDSGYRPRATTEKRAAADREHVVDHHLALRPTSSGSSSCGRTTSSYERPAGQSSATSMTTDIWWRRSTRLPRWGSGRRPKSSSSSCRHSPQSASRRGMSRSVSCCRLDILGSRGTPSETIVREHLKLLQNHQ